MSLVKTYFDSGIYILALRSYAADSKRAKQTINDSQRWRVTSDVLLLELLPFSLRHNNLREINALNVMVNQAPEFIRLDSVIIDLAIAEQATVKNTLGIADLLHITIAKHTDCTDFITTERPGSPLYQLAGINIVAF